MAINDAAAAGTARPRPRRRRGAAPDTTTPPASAPSTEIGAGSGEPLRLTTPPTRSSTTTAADCSAGAVPVQDGDPPVLPVDALVRDVAATVRRWLTDVAGRAPGHPVTVLVEADPGRLQVVLTGDGDGDGAGEDGARGRPTGRRGRTVRRRAGRSVEDQDEGDGRMRWSGPLT